MVFGFKRSVEKKSLRFDIDADIMNRQNVKKVVQREAKEFIDIIRQPVVSRPVKRFPGKKSKAQGKAGTKKLLELL